VASHFDSSGQPDDWSSKAGTLGWLVPIGVGLPLLFSIRWIWEKLPSQPSSTSRSRTIGSSSGEHTYLYRLPHGVHAHHRRRLLALLLTSVLVMIMREGRGATMPTGMTFIPTGVFLIITAAALINLVRRRPPR
jgi:hypothetical protein